MRRGELFRHCARNCANFAPFFAAIDVIAACNGGTKAQNGTRTASRKATTIQQVVFRIKTVVAEDGTSAIERIYYCVRKLMGQKPNVPPARCDAFSRCRRRVERSR